MITKLWLYNDLLGIKNIQTTLIYFFHTIWVKLDIKVISLSIRMIEFIPIQINFQMLIGKCRFVWGKKQSTPTFYFTMIWRLS